MKFKAIAIVTLLVCIVAAWRDLTAKPPPIERLLETPVSFPDNSIGGVRQIPLPSEHLTGLRQSGRINVFTFYSASSAGSQKLRGYIEQFTNMRPDAAFQILDLGAQWRQVDCEKTFGIKLESIPHVVIYDSDGTLLARDTSDSKDGLDLLLAWMRKEVESQPAESQPPRSRVVPARGPRTST
jgi:hypothetical protein